MERRREAMQLQATVAPQNEPRPATPRLPGVIAGVGYLVPPQERPFNYMYEPPAGKPWQNCEYSLSPVQITDARATVQAPGIDAEGFELWDAPTAMVEFSDVSAIQSRYFEETAELAKCVTGADRAYIFDYSVRQREAGRPVLTFGRKDDPRRTGAVGRVHSDYSEASGQKRFEIVSIDGEVRLRVNRFAIVNIWRSIGGVIADTPLALCDARTVSAKDLVTCDLVYPDRFGEIYLVQHSPRHKWSYFSGMDRHEALIFKQYDSQVNGVARFTPHSAFDLPDIPPGAPLRQSIEVRCLLTYG
jgi:hypothetical protein